MTYPTGYSRENLTARAKQLRGEIERFITDGKEFNEVKKIYQEYKEVLKQLQKLDGNHVSPAGGVAPKEPGVDRQKQF